jgi:hypothetical protein
MVGPVPSNTQVLSTPTPGSRAAIRAADHVSCGKRLGFRPQQEHKKGPDEALNHARAVLPNMISTLGFSSDRARESGDSSSQPPVEWACAGGSSRIAGRQSASVLRDKLERAAQQLTTSLLAILLDQLLDARKLCRSICVWLNHAVSVMGDD